MIVTRFRPEFLRGVISSNEHTDGRRISSNNPIICASVAMYTFLEKFLDRQSYRNRSRSEICLCSNQVESQRSETKRNSSYPTPSSQTLIHLKLLSLAGPDAEH